MISVKVQEEGRTQDKAWKNKYEEKKLVYRVALCILLLTFSQIKNVYTLRKNSLVKTRLDLNNNLYLSTFRSHDLFQDRLLSHWTR